MDRITEHWSKAILALAALASFPGIVWAESPHFIKSQTQATIVQNGDLVVKWKEAGLADNVLINYEASADGSATCTCVTKSGKCPAAANKVTASGPVSATGAFDSDKNGTISSSLEVSPPPCPPSEARRGTLRAKSWTGQPKMSAVSDGRLVYVSLPYARHRGRLAQEAREPGLGEAAGRLLVAVAAHQDDAGVGANAADLAEHAVAGEARQGEVDDHRVDRARVRAKHVDALAAVARLEHAAAEPLEHVGGHGAHVLLVVHQEHGALLAALAPGAAAGGCSVSRSASGPSSTTPVHTVIVPSAPPIASEALMTRFMMT